MLLAQGLPNLLADYPWLWAVLIVGGLLVTFFIYIFFSFLHLYVRCFLTGAGVGLIAMVRMSVCRINYNDVIERKIALVQAGVTDTEVRVQDLEAHVLAGGRLEKVVKAVIAARKAGMDLPWSTAAAIDLAGRDIEEAVARSVDPKVIDCPDPKRGTLDGVCRDGIQLKVRARVTVRTKLKGLIGGATEETIVARVGEGIVKAIGSAQYHTDVLANPNLISRAVLNNALDSQTAFEIVSIDVAEIEVGVNVGANLQTKQADADLRVAQANAEKRRALAVAQEQEMRAKVEENRALLVLAEAEVPRAIAHALRDGKMNMLDYYQLKNLQSDTEMRSAIAGVSSNTVPGNHLADRPTT